MRREGLYASRLTTWRRQRDTGVLQALRPQKRDRKARRQDPLIQENDQLYRANNRLLRKLEQAETIIEFRKNLRVPRDPPQPPRTR